MDGSAVKEVYRDYAERGGFITVLDLHDQEAKYEYQYKSIRDQQAC